MKVERIVEKVLCRRVPCSLALRVTAAVRVRLLPADMRTDCVALGVTPSRTTQIPLLHSSARLSICRRVCVYNKEVGRFVFIIKGAKNQSVSA